MAENETDGAKGSFRQSQNSRKRREPPVIDGTATDVSGRSESADGDGADTVPPTVAETPSVPSPSASVDEPVLFGQVLRGPAPQSEGAELESATVANEPPHAPHPDPIEAAVSDTPPEASLNEAQEGPGFAATTARSDETSAFNLSGSGTGGGGIYGDHSTSSGPESVLPPMAPPARRSLATTLLGALVVILLVVIAGLLFTEPQRVGTDDLKAGLDAAKGRIDALEARADPGKLSEKVAQIDQRGTSVETDLAALKTATQASTSRLDDLASKLDDTAAKLSSLSASPPAVPATDAAPAAATAADLAALSGRVDELARKVEAAPPAQAGVDLAPVDGKIGDLTQRLEALQASVAALPKVDLGPLDKQVTDLDRRLGEFNHSLTALSAAFTALPKTDLEPLKAAIAAIDQRLSPIESALSAPKAGDRTTEARAVGSTDEARAAPLAVVAEQASRGIEDGRPIVPEVDALRALGIDDSTLAPLAAIAEKGAPTLGGLKSDWAEAEAKILDAIRPPPTGSLLDRFAAGARQIVTVRRVGAPIGEDAASVAARVSAALDAGDIEGALAEWAKLPDASRASSQAWADAAKSRLDAEAAARGLASSAIEILAKAKG